MEIDSVEKPLRKLRKLLKNLPEDPAPDEVHKLRTGARRIEAVASALEPAGGKKTRRLLKAIKPVRKAAGGVRDMDVLTGNLLNLPRDGGGKSRVRLIEHLGSARRAGAEKLLDAVDRQRKTARKELKKYERLVESVASGKKPVRMETALAVESNGGSAPAAEGLVAELTHWPALNAHNLHPFRLKVKELRYVLQMYPEAHRGFVEALGRVKDEIGDWHDWQQLEEIARQVLDTRQDAELLALIDKTTRQKCVRALAGAQALRRRYLHGSARRRAS